MNLGGERETKLSFSSSIHFWPFSPPSMPHVLFCFVFFIPPALFLLPLTHFISVPVFAPNSFLYSHVLRPHMCPFPQVTGGGHPGAVPCGANTLPRPLQTEVCADDRTTKEDLRTGLAVSRQ